MIEPKASRKVRGIHDALPIAIRPTRASDVGRWTRPVAGHVGRLPGTKTSEPMQDKGGPTNFPASGYPEIALWGERENQPGGRLQGRLYPNIAPDLHLHEGYSVRRSPGSAQKPPGKNSLARWPARDS